MAELIQLAVTVVIAVFAGVFLLQLAGLALHLVGGAIYQALRCSWIALRWLVRYI